MSDGGPQVLLEQLNMELKQHISAQLAELRSQNQSQRLGGRRRLKSDGFDVSKSRSSPTCSLTLPEESTTGTEPVAMQPLCVFGAHLSFQHVSLQARAILLGAVGPANGQAVRLPLLLGLAGGDVAPALHRHASVQSPNLSGV